jgi:hypothetical protein
MPGSTTKTKSRSRDSITYAALQMTGFDTVAAVAISQTANLIQAQFMLPYTCKIFAAAPSFTAFTGPATFNVVAGTGTYETAAGAYAATTSTISGTVAAGYVYTSNFQIPFALAQSIGIPAINTLGILGNPLNPLAVTIPVVIVAGAAATATSVAAQFVLAINTNPVLNNLIYAANAAGVITYTAVQAGTALNTFTVLSGAVGAGSAITATSTFAGGTATTGVVVGVNDQFEYNGTTNFAPAGAGALGATPIFNTDMPLFAPTPGGNAWMSSNFDVVYQQGSIMTLRVVTGGAQTITNFKVMLALMAHDPTPQLPSFNTFDPHVALN